MYIHYNPNPIGRSNTGDCVIRAVAKALNDSWENSYIRLCIAGFGMGDLPNADTVYGAVLRMHGFKRRVIPDTCPDCYTVEAFCNDNPRGIFVIGLGGHVVTVVNGDIYDAWDSSNEIPVYYWYKEMESMNDEYVLSAAPSTNASADTVSVPEPVSKPDAKPDTGKPASK